MHQSVPDQISPRFFENHSRISPSNAPTFEVFLMAKENYEIFSLTTNKLLT
jgi:hypothetical protein